MPPTPKGIGTRREGCGASVPEVWGRKGEEHPGRGLALIRVGLGVLFLSSDGVCLWDWVARRSLHPYPDPSPRRTPAQPGLPSFLGVVRTAAPASTICGGREGAGGGVRPVGIRPRNRELGQGRDRRQRDTWGAGQGRGQVWARGWQVLLGPWRLLGGHGPTEAGGRTEGRGGCGAHLYIHPRPKGSQSILTSGDPCLQDSHRLGFANFGRRVRLAHLPEPLGSTGLRPSCLWVLTQPEPPDPCLHAPTLP